MTASRLIARTWTQLPSNNHPLWEGWAKGVVTQSVRVEQQVPARVSPEAGFKTVNRLHASEKDSLLQYQECVHTAQRILAGDAETGPAADEAAVRLVTSAMIWQGNPKSAYDARSVSFVSPMFGFTQQRGHHCCAHVSYRCRCIAEQSHCRQRLLAHVMPPSSSLAMLRL